MRICAPILYQTKGWSRDLCHRLVESHLVQLRKDGGEQDRYIFNYVVKVCHLLSRLSHEPWYVAERAAGAPEVVDEPTLLEVRRRFVARLRGHPVERDENA